MKTTEGMKNIDWLAAFLLLGAGLGGMSLAGGALVSLVYALVDQGQGLPSTQAFLNASGLLVAGLLLFVPAALAIFKLIDRQPPALPSAERWKRGAPLVLALLYPFVLAAGALAANNEEIAWFLLPPIHLLAVAIPLLLLIWLTLRKVGGVSALRGWGALGSGMAASPALAFAVEAFVGLFFLIGGVIYLTTQPELMRSLDRLILRLSYGEPSLEALQNILEPIVADPLLLVAVFAFVALAVPLIEELLKPLAVLVLIRRPLTPADGFALGALSGAGFGLLENLLQGGSAEGWLGLVVARLGTTAVHMLTAGLTGWGIVVAKNHKGYGRLVLAYLAAVAIHALWNALALMLSVASLSEALPDELGIISGVGLLALGLGSTLLLARAHRWLPAAAPTPAEDGPAA